MATSEIVAMRGRLPTTTCHQARLRIFQATRRPRNVDEVCVTSWGRVRVKGRLGQQHADVFETICYRAQRTAPTPDGRIKLLVDPAEVRRVARQSSGSTFMHVIEDLMQALIEIMAPMHLACVGHLIDHIDLAQRANGEHITRFNPLGGTRTMWRTEIGRAACKLLDADLWLHRDPTPIAALRHGISQAVARHILTHRAGTCDRWGMDTLIRMVAGDLQPQQMRDRRRELCADFPALARMGVRVADVEQKPGGVDHKPDALEQKPGGVDHKPGIAEALQDSQDPSGS